MVSRDPGPEPIDRYQEQHQADQVLQPGELHPQRLIGGVGDKTLQAEDRQQRKRDDPVQDDSDG
ncbi:hypothetical protein D3C86_2043510 [compost metagenome]